jgi:hypothetical protein
MTHRIDPDRIEATRSERLLAVVLAVFLLIGLLWGYVKLGEVDRELAPRNPAMQLSPADRATLAHANALAASAEDAAASFPRPHRVLVDRREAYRTALDAGRDDPRLGAAYRAARIGLAHARDDARRTRVQARSMRTAAAPARARLAAARRAEDHRVEDHRREHDLIVAGLRVLLVLATLAGGLWLLSALRQRRSRWIVVAHAAVGAATALALFTVGDYLSDVVTPADLGPLALSLIGTLLTLLAIAALHRYLARSLPGRRVLRGDCPFCGYPGRGAHCEGCGREIVASCARCAAARRVGSRHCAACGEA